MTDPLGFIHRVNSGGDGMPRIGGDSAPTQGPSFKDVLLKNIDQVNKLQQEATQATEDLMTGKRGDLEGVILATHKADTAFRMLLSLRNKVQTALEEVKQMRV
jgi:flagellar hook-basal body complex protein FliE